MKIQISNSTEDNVQYDTNCIKTKFKEFGKINNMELIDLNYDGEFALCYKHNLPTKLFGIIDRKYYWNYPLRINYNPYNGLVSICLYTKELEKPLLDYLNHINKKIENRDVILFNGNKLVFSITRIGYSNFE